MGGWMGGGRRKRKRQSLAVCAHNLTLSMLSLHPPTHPPTYSGLGPWPMSRLHVARGAQVLWREAIPGRATTLCGNSTFVAVGCQVGKTHPPIHSLPTHHSMWELYLCGRGLSGKKRKRKRKKKRKRKRGSLFLLLYLLTHPPTHPQPTVAHSNRLVLLYLFNPPTHPLTHPPVQDGSIHLYGSSGLRLCPPLIAGGGGIALLECTHLPTHPPTPLNLEEEEEEEEGGGGGVEPEHMYLMAISKAGEVGGWVGGWVVGWVDVCVSFSLLSCLPPLPPTHVKPTLAHSNRLVLLYLPNPPTHPPTHLFPGTRVGPLQNDCLVLRLPPSALLLPRPAHHPPTHPPTLFSSSSSHRASEDSPQGSASAGGAGTW